jgi:hypothetical protein
VKLEDEKIFDEQFDKLLASSSNEVRAILEPKRGEFKLLTDQVQQDIKTTDNMLRKRLGWMYPFIVPQGDSVPLFTTRPRLGEMKL